MWVKLFLLLLFLRFVIGKVKMPMRPSGYRYWNYALDGTIKTDSTSINASPLHKTTRF